jgi:pyruvate carboxylase
VAHGKAIIIRIADIKVLLTLEAMKMETTVRAERDGVVAEIFVKPGLQVDAKDLLVVLT